jgi:hypothetical protein
MMKVAIFAFRGEPVCFMHALLNAMDMRSFGYDVKLIVEGEATRLLGELEADEAPFSRLFRKVSEEGILDCVCKACSANMGTLEEAERQGLPICSEMSGHPSMARYIDAGYQIIVL